MRAESKGNVKNSVGRLIFAGLAFCLQTGWIVLLFLRLNAYSATLSLISSFLAFLLALWIYGKPSNAAFKMPWIMLILVFPVLGICIYGLFGHKEATKKIRVKFNRIHSELMECLRQKPEVMEALEEQGYDVANQFRYLLNQEGYPLYRNTDVEFYKEASDGLVAQLAALKEAREYVFLDYHAIEEAEAFGQIRDILADKAAEGVEVRILYDDVGSIGFITPEFIKRMEGLGIRCKVFNPVMPVMQIFMNNRDHRKIMVIDGRVGFTGGYNLADEYFNIIHPYGYWKDTGIRLMGEAVKSLTVMFLEMWNLTEKCQEDYTPYLKDVSYQSKENGFIQPYADSPMQETVGENVYLNVIKQAKHYFYASTPYLIISDEMIRELSMAAERGVDVRIITPGIPDKKVIYRVTRSYYASLVRHGVRIYEYTPGFNHAKQTVADARVATVGTINMDYRSLYHHFENGVLLYGCRAISEIEKDFLETFDKCREVTEKYRQDKFTVVTGVDCVLRLFAPLM